MSTTTENWSCCRRAQVDDSWSFLSLHHGFKKDTS